MDDNTCLAELGYVQPPDLNLNESFSDEENLAVATTRRIKLIRSTARSKGQTSSSKGRSIISSNPTVADGINPGSQLEQGNASRKFPNGDRRVTASRTAELNQPTRVSVRMPAPATAVRHTATTPVQIDLRDDRSHAAADVRLRINHLTIA